MGRGRPGWHIECSAMAEEAFGGVDFEIHGGGSDLIFPHHENEIAQTEAARGEPLAKIWMHNGMLQVDREKGSKSLGNLPRLGHVRGVRTRRARHVLRARSLPQADRLLRRRRSTGAPVRAARAGAGAPARPGRSAGGLARKRSSGRFYEALDDDFNTPQALAVVFELVAEANKRLGEGSRSGRGRCVNALTLGLENLLEA